jgi:hypothetical protein
MEPTNHPTRKKHDNKNRSNKHRRILPKNLLKAQKRMPKRYLLGDFWWTKGSTKLNPRS